MELRYLDEYPVDIDCSQSINIEFQTVKQGDDVRLILNFWRKQETVEVMTGVEEYHVADLKTPQNPILRVV